jgi:hypothetical protein
MWIKSYLTGFCNHFITLNRVVLKCKESSFWGGIFSYTIDFKGFISMDHSSFT